MENKSNKPLIVITVCLAIAVVVLSLALFSRGSGDENKESSTEASVNIEISETVSDDISNEISNDTSGDMSNSSCDDEISSEVSEREESQPANNTSIPSTPESSDDKTNNETSSNSGTELEFSTSASGRLYAVISDEDLKAGRQAVKEYAAKYIGETPKSGKTAFNGNEILDFYNEAFLAVSGSRSNGETNRFVSSRFDMDYSYILYDEASLSLPFEPFSYYISYVGDGEALLEELCEYYFSHFTDDSAMELFPELVLYKGRLYDIVTDGFAGKNTVRREEKYKTTETDSGYEIQVSFYLSPEDIEMYFMYTMEPSGLNKETGENVFTYSIIKEDGIWAFNTSKMHCIYASSDYGQLDWEFTY